MKNGNQRKNGKPQLNYQQKKEAGLSEFVFGKVQPQALQLEESTLGAIMLDKDAIFIVTRFLKPYHFYMDAHQLIFEAMLELSINQKPIDLLTVTENLKSSGNLEKVGGPYYLVELTNRVASAANIEYHASIILDKWQCREIIRSATEAIRSCYENNPAQTVLDEMNTQLIKVTEGLTSNLVDVKEALAQVFERAKKIKESEGHLVGINLTMIESFERAHGGGEEGDLMVLSGFKGSGKSSILNNIRINAILSNIPIYEWSGEMPARGETERTISGMSGVDSNLIRSGEFWDNEKLLELVTTAEESIKNYKSKMHFDNGKRSLSYLVSAITNHARLYGTKIFLLDRIELMNLEDLSKDPNISKSTITSTFRSLAAQLKITIILIAQMTKDVERNPYCRPMMGNVLGSGAITDNATKVVLIHRPEVHGESTFDDDEPCEGLVDLILAKNTNGKLDKIRCKFIAKNTLFESLDGKWMIGSENPKSGKLDEIPF